VGGGRFVSVGIFLVMVVVIFAGLIHHAGRMAFGHPGIRARRGGESASCVVAMALLTAVMLLLGLSVPATLNRLLERAMEVVLG
jgi:hydrogenase-4 component F